MGVAGASIGKLGTTLSATQLERGLQTWLVPYARALYYASQRAGLKPRITSVYRSPQQQAVLYQRYLRGLSMLPAAPPGRSKHQLGLAFDMVTTNPELVGRTWLAWGGKWWPSDPVHFEV